MSTIITLIIVALILFFFEIFAPGGILGFMGVILMIGACASAYIDYGAMGASVTFIFCLIISIGMLVLELKIIPKTKFGQKFFHKGSNQAKSVERQAGDEIIGKEGETYTRLNPTGIVLIDGKQYEAFSQEGLLEKGASIRVVNQDAFRIIVEKV